MKTHSTGHIFNDILLLVYPLTHMTRPPPIRLPQSLHVAVFTYIALLGTCQTSWYRITHGWLICLKNMPC